MAAASEPDRPAAGEKLFAETVGPLFKAKCLGCHGDDEKLRGGLDLRSREALLRGGDNGPVLVPGDADNSSLYHTTLRGGDIKMPPKEEQKLTAAETAALRDWINAGAPWAEAKVVAKEEWKVDPKDAWAFQPVRRYDLPTRGVAARWVRTPVDAFISQKLIEKKLTPAPPADRPTLLRRVTYDLTGLPPTPAEVDAFLADTSPDAWEKVIDRLLASPRYGERWGRHWLDVARYADSSGFSNDYERPNAWRYRDYVIRAFNADKPYDRFVLEQIAGDELPDADAESRLAVGYLRMGPWEHTGMSVAAVTRQLFLDDVTNAVGTTFLALPLNCCRCHDHKFDPLPTRDYYRVQACFAPAQFDERATPFLPSENTAGFDEAAAAVRARLQDTEAKLKEVDKADPSVQEELRRTYQKRKLYYELALQRYQPQAFSVSSDPKKKAPKGVPPVNPEVFVLVGGALTAPGEKVTPGVLGVVPGSHDDVPVRPQGRRLALARWMASEKNPLTARVMVNRVWQYHFGKGLVETSNNFGKMGKRPTHPELLDWLADQFVRGGWSVKALHRLILRSAVYQTADEHPDMQAVRAADPLNERLAHFPPRRLSAEEIRDSLLAVAGELSPTAGGPPTNPEINWDVALQPRQIMGALAPMYEPSPKKEQRHRRTVYTVQIRGLGNPFLEVFNAPNPDASCERREESTVTPQVFSLFNGTFPHDMALALARRVEQAAPDHAGQVRHAFRLCFGRLPTDRELDLCLAHFDAMLAHHRATPPAARDLPRTIVRERVAEFTGATVRIAEDWDAGAYERTVQPADVAPETRALAEVCLALLNSNEFVYVH